MNLRLYLKFMPLDNITYLPIYLCYLLKEKKLEKMIIDLDLSGL